MVKKHDDHGPMNILATLLYLSRNLNKHDVASVLLVILCRVWLCVEHIGVTCWVHLQDEETDCPLNITDACNEHPHLYVTHWPI